MLGAIIGDIVGSRFKWDNYKAKDFEFFTNDCFFTDDSVMSLALCEALLESKPDFSDLREQAVAKMRAFGEAYPDAGYGRTFSCWLYFDDPQPYNSYGNGSAMRVSGVVYATNTLKQVKQLSLMVTDVTHNHPEGVKGAEAVASAIFLARTGAEKAAIRDYVVTNFGYDLSRSCDEIRPTYSHVESCQETVPEALTAFLEGEDFEDVVRTAVSLGGDCDTLTCIAASIAEAFYGVPENLVSECRARLPEEMLAVIDRFWKIVENR